MSSRNGKSSCVLAGCLAALGLTAISPGGQAVVQDPVRAAETGETRFAFDAAVLPALNSRLSDSGEVLVRPLLNDKEVGWFILDPAVEGMRIVPSLADDLGLPASGPVRLITTTRTEERRAWSCSKFLLGPLLAEGLEMTEMKSSGGEAGALPIAGVVGTAVLRAVTVEMDFLDGAVRFFEPSSYPDPAAAWQEFKVRYSLPVLPCRFEGESEGEFGLDVRSPLGIVFFRPKVEELGILEGRATKPAFITGAGFGRVPVLSGVLEWFQVAGLWLSEPQAVFMTQDINIPASRELTGMLGRQVVQNSTLILDYSRSRLAIVSRR